MKSDEEKQPGIRLREFRENLQIPRSRFAVSVGFGSERIASYEAGRAPLLYSVFLPVQKRYSINPYWLATGTGDKAWPYYLGSICNVPFLPRESFLKVFHDTLSARIEKWMIAPSLASQPTLKEEAFRQLQEMEEVNRAALSESDHQEIEKQINFLKRMIAGALPLDVKNQAMLDNVPRAVHDEFVQNKFRNLKELIEHLRGITSVRGAKAALAKEFNVTRQAVDQWLSGESKPSAEIAIRLQHWKFKPAK